MSLINRVKNNERRVKNNERRVKNVVKDIENRLDHHDKWIVFIIFFGMCGGLIVCGYEKMWAVLVTFLTSIYS